ncbi:MAG: hypothetical protein ACI90V_011331 [Bacillariaceae sp.]|jgi:hypothetical protein
MQSKRYAHLNNSARQIKKGWKTKEGQGGLVYYFFLKAQSTTKHSLHADKLKIRAQTSNCYFIVSLAFSFSRLSERREK